MGKKIGYICIKECSTVFSGADLAISYCKSDQVAKNFMDAGYDVYEFDIRHLLGKKVKSAKVVVSTKDEDEED